MFLRIAAWFVALSTLVVQLVLLLELEPHVPEFATRRITPFMAIAALAPAIVGLLIAIRQPRNVIAWILLVGSITSPSALLIPDAGWSLQIGRALWPLLYAWVIAVAFVFPNGRLLSRRWRWAASVGAFCYVAFMSLALLDTTPYDPPYASVPNPIVRAGVDFPDSLEWIWVPLWLGILASLFAAAIAIRLRLRRSTGIERLQTLWLAWACSLIPIGLRDLPRRQLGHPRRRRSSSSPCSCCWRRRSRSRSASRSPATGCTRSSA